MGPLNSGRCAMLARGKKGVQSEMPLVPSKKRLPNLEGVSLEVSCEIVVEDTKKKSGTNTMGGGGLGV